MTKERAAAFTDAVLAIIMTILVLDLEHPSALTFDGFWELRHVYFAYALSFFWLGSMWVNVTTEWEQIDHVSHTVLWRLIIMLFFSSLIPYTTSIVSDNFDSAVAQCIYGIVVIAVTISNIAVAAAVEDANGHISKEQHARMRKRRQFLWIDCSIKTAGFIIAALVWPPAMMVSIIVAAAFIIPAASMVYREDRKAA